jgi:hypothetical protein
MSLRRQAPAAERWCIVTYPRPDRSLVKPNFVKTAEKDLRDLLVRESLGAFVSDREYVQPMPWKDASGNNVWSVGVVMSDDAAVYAESPLVLTLHARPND